MERKAGVWASRVERGATTGSESVVWGPRRG